jgi:hypothetical protein
MNCFVGDKAVHLFTDGANYDTDTGGEVKGFMSKVLPLPHYHAVISSTGVGWASTMIGVQITLTEIEGFDDLIAKMPAIVEATKRQAANVPNMPPMGATNVLFAGWSPTQGPCAYMLWTEDMDGLEAFEVKQVSGYRTPTNRFIDAMDFSPEQAETDGLTIMQAQRDTPGMLRDGSGKCGHLVGGFCQHTIIDESGIHMRSIHAWPDKVGMPIKAPRAKEGMLF